ncbi:MAG: alpha-1,2-fucosyltransferase [Flavobacteriales bacterium]|nr:alpha-1,2-fucosyltransferase [Flavobacteriales bacterium]
MIITRIYQGLGNQLFQYACGKALALRNGDQLKLDTTFYENSEVTQFGFTYKRNFEIARYSVAIVEASKQEIDVFKGVAVPSIWQRILYRLNKNSRPQRIEEDLSKFTPEITGLKGDVYLNGYFTSEEFFKDYAHVIRKEFTLKNEMSEENCGWAEKMANCNSVCISYRRTNFVNNPLHEVCFMDYYLDGLRKVEQLLGQNITVFIWSDDNEWTRENFRPPYECHYMTHNFPDFHEDLRLMTRCKHHVIPNSTFSWWAAWLGEWENQIVIAPERWLNSTEIEYGHVIPERWHKIKN